jgi:small subunit ribosomal protein S8
MYNDTVSDFITRLRNAQLAGKNELAVRSNKLVRELSRVLENEGILTKIAAGERELTVTLSEAGLSHIKRLSKPSLRQYVSYKDIPKPKSGFGLVILSTNKGVLTGNQARKQKVGGELICEVW